MSAAVLAVARARAARHWRMPLIAAAVIVLVLLLVLPLAVVFAEALRQGAGLYLESFADPAARAAIRLTLLVAAIALPLNVAFGIAAAWAITRFAFRGKSLLVTLIDLPFAVSPVVAGLVFVLLFGRSGWLAPVAQALDVQVLFALPGIVLATLFVTFPFVARELIPLLQEQGRDQEEAARLMGASGWQILFRITLPRAKWALLYGVILSNARAMGEFGAVSVVSGHIRGHTSTIPLHVELLYNEYNIVAAFAMASLLMLLALATMLGKYWLERHGVQQRRTAA
jgi:sulfate transport system permease protein